MVPCNLRTNLQFHRATFPETGAAIPILFSHKFSSLTSIDVPLPHPNGHNPGTADCSTFLPPRGRSLTRRYAALPSLLNPRSFSCRTDHASPLWSLLASQPLGPSSSTTAKPLSPAAVAHAAASLAVAYLAVAYAPACSQHLNALEPSRSIA